jgi:ABC-type bacteriocin/lantibiotic exporter with double-glycine peptidase domain
LIAFFNLSTAIFIEKLIDILIPSGDNLKIIIALLSWGAILIIRAVVSLLRDESLIKLSFNVQGSLTGVYIRKLLMLPKDFFDGRKTGDLSSRLNDMERIQSSLSNLLGQDVIDILTLICSIIFVLFYNLSIGIFMIGLLPIYFIVIYSVQRKIYKSNHSIMQSFATAESDYLDSLSGISSIKIGNKEGLFFKRIFNGFNKYLKNVKQISSTITRHRTSNDFLGIFALVFIVLFSISAVFSDDMQVGDLVAIVSIVSISFAAITKLAISITKFQETRVAFERAYEVISSPEEYVLESNQPVPITDFSSINIVELSFGFPGQENLFENINFEIKKGSSTFIFGSIGTGKSTLLQILQKFYLANSGEILVNNINLNEINTALWRSQIGVVPQDLKVFNDTIFFNICLDSNFKDNDIIDFCTSYGFDNFFDSLPQQYETIVGETGVRLSGGQKQILAISRALFTKPKFLLLDEPTSSMDYKTENFILCLLKELKENMGILVITHKRELKPFADNIFYLGEAES